MSRSAEGASSGSTIDNAQTDLIRRAQQMSNQNTRNARTREAR